MEPVLPQHDPDPGPRYRKLSRAQDTYRYDHMGPIALLAHLPAQDRFGLSYGLKRFFTAGRFALNIAAVRIRQALRPGRTLKDYSEYFPIVRRKPSALHQWHDDALYGWQRLAGPNPLDLRRLDAPPADFPVRDAMVQAVAGPEASLAALIADGRAFLTDHRALGGLCARLEQRGLDRYLCAPRVLYVLGPQGLRPAAIQLGPATDPSTPIFSTADGADWLAAKLFAQCADTTSHEMIHHLAQTHLVLEPVAIAARRQLAENHPIGILLAQHLDSVLAINSFGRETLINPGGFLDQLMPGWLHETLGIVQQGVADYTWGAQDFHADLDARGLRRGSLPDFDFPWRDDGELVWQALHTFIRAYVELYYRSPADVQQDAELQRWIEEMQREGRAKGLPLSLHTPEELIALLTQICWMSGPKHAAVNYAQWDFIAVIPNMPFALYGPAPRAHGAFSDPEELISVLPDRDASLKQILLMEALTGWQHTRLGYYPRRAFRDPRVKPLIKQFRRDLAEVEAAIQERNQGRLLPYPYLLPSRIPNSTNT